MQRRCFFLVLLLPLVQGAHYGLIAFSDSQQYVEQLRPLLKQHSFNSIAVIQNDQNASFARGLLDGLRRLNFAQKRKGSVSLHKSTFIFAF